MNCQQEEVLQTVLSDELKVGENVCIRSAAAVESTCPGEKDEDSSSAALKWGAAMSN
jgi:hypothetical protein